MKNGTFDENHKESFGSFTGLLGTIDNPEYVRMYLYCVAFHTHTGLLTRNDTLLQSQIISCPYNDEIIKSQGMHSAIKQCNQFQFFMIQFFFW